MAPAASTSSSWQALYCQYIICGGDRRRRLRMWREKKGISRVLEDNWLVHSLIDSLRLRESIGIYNTHMGYLTWGFPAQQPRLAGLITTHTWRVFLIFILFFSLFIKNICRNFFFAKMSSCRQFIRRKVGTAGWTGGRCTVEYIPPVEPAVRLL